MEWFRSEQQWPEIKMLLRWLYGILFVVPRMRTEAVDQLEGQLGETIGKKLRLYSLVAEVLLSIMGFIGLGAEFVLRPAGGGVDRSERWSSRRDTLIIKPHHKETMAPSTRKRKRTEVDIKKVFCPHGIGTGNVSVHTRPLDPLETL